MTHRRLLDSALVAAALAYPALGQDGHDEHKHAAEAAKPTDAAVVIAQGPSYPLGTCAVSGKKLDSMGGVIDHVVEGRLVRLCCAGCIDSVDAHPAKAIAKIDEAVIAAQKPTYPLATDPVSGEELGADAIDHVHGTRLVRFATKASMDAFVKAPRATIELLDKALMDAQRESYPLKECVVSGEALGGMGKPIDRLYGTRLVRLCCKGCIKQFEKDPQSFVAKIDAAGKSR